jgi:dTDP-4-dehydrorhamnose reductase
VKPLLIFGRDGQVAQKLSNLLSGQPATFLGHKEFDLSASDPTEAIAKADPWAVINASGYTAVDRAESEAETALRLNRDAPAAMARACAQRGIPFVHMSTDYVFDGAKTGEYIESDPAAPLTVYGSSKAEGEVLVIEAGGCSAILRTSWVFGDVGGNFVNTMLRLADKNDEISVVADQHGRPTWAQDVASASLAAAHWMQNNNRALGILHAAGSDAMTWADFAERIFAIAEQNGLPSARVIRITTQDYPTPARRPANSRLAIGAIEATLGWRPTPITDALSQTIQNLKATS